MRYFAYFMIVINMLFLPMMSFAQDRAQIGVVAALDGTLILRYEQISRQVKAGDKLLFGDEIITDQNSKAQILLKDRTALTIAPNTQLLIDEFIYEPQKERNVTSQLLQGAVKISSPRLSNAIQSKRKLLMPNATVSIRGTEFLAQVTDGDDFVVLLTGVVDVQNSQFTRELAKPNFGVSITDEGLISPPEFLDDKALGVIFDVFTPQNSGTTDESDAESNSGGDDESNSGGNAENETDNSGPSEGTVESQSENALASEQPANAVSQNSNAAPSEPVILDEALTNIAVSLATPVDAPAFDIVAPIGAVNDQITQELNEVIDSVSSAISEGENNDPSATDSDGDGVLDEADAFPNDPNESVDTDGDGIGNNADTDDDGDGVADSSDPNPLVNDTLDTDGDGTLDIVDTDDDGDGVADSADAFPLDANESADTDGDGTGDNADTLDNSRLVKAPNSTVSSSGWTSSSWNDIASELGSGTATFTANNQTASHSSGSNCIGCSADVDTTLTIDFSDMDYRFTAETTFTKPTYDPVTFTASSLDIPLGQYSLSSGSFTSVNSHNDLQSTYDQDIAMTFTSTTDPSVQVTADMSASFYYDAYQSDTSDLSSTNLGVRGYTKIIYDDANSGIDQHNTPFYSMDPQ